MTQPVYQQGAERTWWWKVAHHLDEAQIASVNAMAYNLDDPSTIFAFQEVIRQAQVLLLEIFGAKGLLPPAIEAPSAVSTPIEAPSSMVSMPSGMSMPMPPPGMSMSMPPSGMSMPLPPMMAAAFDPFDPVAGQQPAPVEVVQIESSQDHVEPPIATPDVAVAAPEISAQVEVPEAEA